MKLEVFNQVLTFDKAIRLLDLLPADNTKYLAAKVNNRLRELNFKIDFDAKIEFIDLTSTDAVNIYQTSLRYLIAYAVDNLYPNARLVFNYSVSRSIFASITGIEGGVSQEVVERIDKEVKRLISLDLPISRYSISTEEAKKYYTEHHNEDKTSILAYRKEETVHMYQCQNYLNYMFGYMVPSTRYLANYIIRQYNPGFIIQYPRAEVGGVIPTFEDAPTFGKALKEANKWGSIIDGSYIAKMNKIIEEKRAVEFINLCETKHNNMLAELGMIIKNGIDDIRLIAVAGPSSSGKTTFTNRLRIELMSRGINPLMISIDDYYFGKESAPKDEDGNPDLEHINALDTKLFNSNIFDLIQGKAVTLPHFNFETGKREVGRTVQISAEQPILIEGIHALNDELTPSIPTDQKFKIYIAPQAQLHIDDHNPISITDIRLLRRIVRDFKFRNSPAIGTLSMWSSVRRGEFKWIYPYQEKANYVFNSELTYELCVMKKYALEMLRQIDRESEHFITANRLIKFLKYFKDIDEKWIPCNSILREFIGGSSFYEK